MPIEAVVTSQEWLSNWVAAEGDRRMLVDTQSSPLTLRVTICFNTSQANLIAYGVSAYDKLRAAVEAIEACRGTKKDAKFLPSVSYQDEKS